VNDVQSAVLRGAKYGLAAGLALAIAYVQWSTVPTLGFYPGSVLLVAALFGGAGAAIGAGIGWFAAQPPPDNFPPHGPDIQ
jgi:hypothetical protein